MDINTCSAVIVGGASGLGAATARIFAMRGTQVCILDIDEAKGEALAQRIGGQFIKTDVTDWRDVARAFDKIKASLSNFRILVNCAGILQSFKIDDENAQEQFSKSVNINLIGCFNVTSCAVALMKQLPVMDDGERGVIVNTASISGYEGQIGQVAYSASKAGIIGMTLPIARELADVGIRCNAIAPGVFETPLVKNMPEAAQASLAMTVPFPKRMGKPGEFAHLVCSICENTMLNGEVIRLDGATRFQAR